jgi:hypothetical protein
VDLHGRLWQWLLPRVRVGFACACGRRLILMWVSCAGMHVSGGFSGHAEDQTHVNRVNNMTSFM